MFEVHSGIAKHPVQSINSSLNGICLDMHNKIILNVRMASFKLGQVLDIWVLITPHISNMVAQRSLNTVALLLKNVIERFKWFQIVVNFSTCLLVSDLDAAILKYADKLNQRFSISTTSGMTE